MSLAPAASAEFTAQDSNNLDSIVFYLDDFDQYLIDMESNTDNAMQNTAYIAGLLDGTISGGPGADLQTIISHVDDLEGLLGLIQLQTDQLENLSTQIESEANQIKTKIQSGNNKLTTINGWAESIWRDTDEIVTLLGDLELNTEPGSAGGNPAPPALVQPVWAIQGLNPVPVIVDPGDPDLTFSPTEPETFVDPDALAVDPFTWDEPTKTGLQSWGVNIPLAGLGTYFGIPTTESINLTTDLSWYGGAPRTALHAAILAIVGFFAATFIFEEFRRTA